MFIVRFDGIDMHLNLGCGLVRFGGTVMLLNICCVHSKV